MIEWKCGKPETLRAKKAPPLTEAQQKQRDEELMRWYFGRFVPKRRAA